MSLPVFTIFFRSILIKPSISNVASCQNRLTISISRESCFVEMYQNISVFAYFPFPQGLQFTNTFPILSRYHTGCINVFAARVSVIFHPEENKKYYDSFNNTMSFRNMRTNNVIVILDDTNILRYTKWRKYAYRVERFWNLGWFNNRSLNIHKIKIYFFSRKIGVISERLIISVPLESERKTEDGFNLLEKFFRIITSYT